MSDIHGHEVLEMMLASGKTYTKASLTDEIRGRFGSHARFYTCSAAGMTAEQLVDFLEAKGKLIPRNGGLQTAASLMCQH